MSSKYFFFVINMQFIIYIFLRQEIWQPMSQIRHELLSKNYTEYSVTELDNQDILTNVVSDIQSRSISFSTRLVTFNN